MASRLSFSTSAIFLDAGLGGIEIVKTNIVRVLLHG
jgi:hypothetical protein